MNKILADLIKQALDIPFQEHNGSVQILDASDSQDPNAKVVSVQYADGETYHIEVRRIR